MTLQREKRIEEPEDQKTLLSKVFIEGTCYRMRERISVSRFCSSSAWRC